MWAGCAMSGMSRPAAARQPERPVLGGNAACEPATTATWPAPKRVIPHDQPLLDDS
jgi:hypothetical protein